MFFCALNRALKMLPRSCCQLQMILQESGVYLYYLCFHGAIRYFIFRLRGVFIAQNVVATRVNLYCLRFHGAIWYFIFRLRGVFIAQNVVATNFLGRICIQSSFDSICIQSALILFAFKAALILFKVLYLVAL